MSPGDRRSEVTEKIAEYPHRLGEEPHVLHESDTLDGGSLLAGLHYSLARLFSSEI